MQNIVKALRAKHNLTQEQLARKIGISRQALSSIENNKVQPSGKVVMKNRKYIWNASGTNFI